MINLWPLIALLWSASNSLGPSCYDSFEDAQLRSWRSLAIRALEAEATIEEVAGESWLKLRCGFGGNLKSPTAFGMLAQGSESEDFDVTVRTQLREGFLAAVTLRCDPERQNCYAGGISAKDKLYLVRILEGRTKVLQSLRLPEQMQDLHRDCWIRFKTERSKLFLKSWPIGEPEPETWQIQGEDYRLREGLAGLGVSCYSPSVGGQPAAEALFDQVRIVLPEKQSPS